MSTLTVSGITAPAALAHTSAVEAVRANPTSISPDGDGADDSARISFRLASRSAVTATVRTGEKSVRTLYRGSLGRGTRTLLWNGANNEGTPVSPGTYTVRLAIRNHHSQRKARVAISVAASPAPAPTPPAMSLAWPVGGTVSSLFGIRGNRPHHGIDITAPANTPIAAGASGRVSQAGDQSGYGKTVVLEHANGYSTVYAHQAQLAVTQGQQVDSGQLIGYVGKTGSADGYHLHLEVRTEQGVPIDPLPLLPTR